MVTKRGTQKEKYTDNSFGVASVVFGVLSIISLSLGGIIMGIIGLVFGIKQKKKHENKWSRAGIALNIIGIVIGVLAIIFFITYTADYLAQLSAGY